MSPSHKNTAVYPLVQLATASDVSNGETKSPVYRLVGYHVKEMASSRSAVDKVVMDHHRERVSQVSNQAKQFYHAGQPYQVSHSSSRRNDPAKSRTTDQPGLQKASLDVSALNHVLHVDLVRRRALVEPNVPMDQLVTEILQRSGGTLVPPVVMSLPGTTAGGGFSGTGGTSSSFRHGFFDETVVRIEMVLADGTVVEADQYARGDLFGAVPGALGSLGTVVLLEIQLVQAHKWVRTTYRRTNSVDETVATLRTVVNDGLRDDVGGGTRIDFVDGIMFTARQAVVVTGELTDDKPGDVRPQTFSNAWDPWFYMHACERANSLGTGRKKTEKKSDESNRGDWDGIGGRLVNDAAVDYIPLAEYLFRYDRGGFWVGRYHLLLSSFVLPFTRFTRWLCDDFLHARMLHRAMHADAEGGNSSSHRLRHQHTFMLQDLAVPFGQADALIRHLDSEFGIWPLWLCPMQRRPGPSLQPAVDAEVVDNTGVNRAAPFGQDDSRASSPTTEFSLSSSSCSSCSVTDTHVLNIGLRGPGPSSRAAFWEKNRALEKKLGEAGGRKWLRENNCFVESDAEFWAQYGGRGWYDALRTTYLAAGALPSVADKARVRPEKAAICRSHSPSSREKGKFFWPLSGILGLWKSTQTKERLLHRKAEWRYKS